MNKKELVAEIERAYDKSENLKQIINAHNKIIILGNGGSNSVAAHLSQDFSKQLKKQAFTFSDPSRLTCYINDYGMEEAYKQFITEFADKDTLIILISSSGNSENMINAMKYCIKQNIAYVILTGFDENNKMNKLNETHKNPAKLSLWVNSKDYGVVECVHQIFLHSII